MVKVGRGRDSGRAFGASPGPSAASAAGPGFIQNHKNASLGLGEVHNADERKKQNQKDEDIRLPHGVKLL